MKNTIRMMIFTLLVQSAFAVQFTMQSANTQQVYGPYELRSGTEITVGSTTLVLDVKPDGSCTFLHKKWGSAVVSYPSFMQQKSIQLGVVPFRLAFYKSQPAQSATARPAARAATRRPAARTATASPVTTQTSRPSSTARARSTQAVAQESRRPSSARNRGYTPGRKKRVAEPEVAVPAPLPAAVPAVLPSSHEIQNQAAVESAECIFDITPKNASVYIDGSMAPGDGMFVEAGKSHNIVVSAAGYESQKMDFVAESNQRYRLEVALRPVAGQERKRPAQARRGVRQPQGRKEITAWEQRAATMQSGSGTVARFGLSTFTGMFGLEMIRDHKAYSAGFIPVGDAPQIYAGYKYYYEPTLNSKYYGFCLGLGMKDEANVDGTYWLIGAVYGYRWRYQSGWDATIGIGPGYFSSSEKYSENTDDNNYLFPLIECAFGYSF